MIEPILVMIEPILAGLVASLGVADDLDAHLSGKLLRTNERPPFNLMGSAGSSVLLERRWSRPMLKYLASLDSILLKEIAAPANLKIGAQRYELEESYLFPRRRLIDAGSIKVEIIFVLSSRRAPARFV